MEEKFPDLYPYFEMIYTKKRKTLYEGHFISVLIGLIQGCGFGPLACASALSGLTGKAMVELRKLDPESMGVMLMDDMTLAGEESSVIKVLEIIKEIGPLGYGAVINPPKTIILALDSKNSCPDSSFPNSKRIMIAKNDGFDVGSKREESGTRLLGSPIGPKEYCIKYFLDRFQTHYKPILEKIKSLNHPGVNWRLWQILSLKGGMIHILRTTQPRLISGAFPEIELEIRRFFEYAIFGRTLTDQQWEIAQLPFALGGWNVIPFEVMSPCAYLASLLVNREKVIGFRPEASDRLDQEIKVTTELILKNDPGAKLPDLSKCPKQKDLVRAVMESRAKALEDSIVDKRMLAVLNGGKAPHANLWKTADHTPENLMNAKTFQIAAQYSVGAPILEKEILCPICKKAPLDVHGDHALICMNHGTVVNRHNDLYRHLVKTGREGLVSIQTERELIFLDKTTWKADLLILKGIPGLTSLPTALDLTVTCNFNKTTVNRSAKEPLAAAMSGETRKMKEFDRKVKEIGYEFVPLAFETTGGHSPTVAPVAHYLITQKALMKNIPFGEVSNSFWQLLSVTMQKANALAILERIRV